MSILKPQKNVALYVDDDADDLLLVKESFAKYATEMDLLTFNDGRTALSYLNNLSAIDPTPCLMILDINMPLMNGKEVLEQIRNVDRYKKTPIIMFSTSTNPADKLFAQQFDAGYVPKPINTTQLDNIAQLFIDYCSDDVKKRIENYLSIW